MTQSKERRLKEKLDLREFKLNALLKVTEAINAQSSESSLMAQYVDALKSNLGIDRLVLYAADLDGQTWKLLVSEGTEATWPTSQPSSFFEKLDLDNIGLAGAMGGDEHPSDVVVPVHQNEEAIALVLAGDTSDDDRGVSPVVKHLNFLVTLTNILVVARRNNQMVAQNLKQEALRRELELAGEMQAMLLPQSWDHVDLDVAGYYQPHTQVGGDYYDAFTTDTGKVVVCMADVSGKGMSAALLMSNFQAQVRALFQAEYASVRVTLNMLNERVMSIAQGEKYITFFVAIYDPSSEALEYVNCGQILLCTSIPMGSMSFWKRAVLAGACSETSVSECRFGEGRFRGILCCYTDGLVEQENELKSLWHGSTPEHAGPPSWAVSGSGAPCHHFCA